MLCDPNDTIRLSDAADLLPHRSGKPVHYNTIRRWVAKGVRGPNGSRIRLQARKVGGVWYTSKTWLAEFEEACTQFSGMEPEQKTQPARKRTAFEKKMTQRALIMRGVYGAKAKKALLDLQKGRITEQDFNAVVAERLARKRLGRAVQLLSKRSE